MVAELYKETVDSPAKPDDDSGKASPESTNNSFKKQISDTSIIKVNYWSFWTVWFVSTFCCCLKSTCRRNKRCERRLNKY